MPDITSVPQAARDFLIDHGLAGPDENPVWVPLTGGVSSELWRVDLEGETMAVKGALAKLKVAGNWHAPTNRNTVEWQWLEYAARVAPAHVPKPLAHDPQRGLFAMTYLAPEKHHVWKERLLSGTVVAGEAADVGSLIGQLHQHSATSADLAARFATDANFEKLRIAPYLRALLPVHPDLTAQIEKIIDRTVTTRKVVVHGDVSPKNILIGPDGPVLLDAECAWFGDPAFDVAFVLNHLLLKMLVVPHRQDALADASRALTEAYKPHVTWEPISDLTTRTAHLLPALMLARVDGLSPVEYLTSEHQAHVRTCARRLLTSGVSSLDEVLKTAREALTTGTH